MAAEHREGCWYPKAVAEEKRWHRAWPNRCVNCEGWGYTGGQHDEFGNFDADVCPDCLERDKCPRCAGGVISETYWDEGQFAICENCGFIEGSTPGAPPLVEDPCECIEPWPGWPDGDYFADLADARDASRRDDPDEPYPYELSDHLYDVERERRRL